MAKPVLSNYPSLLAVLRNNPQANAEFNAVLSTMSSSGPDRAKELTDSLESERTLRAELQIELNKAKATNQKVTRFIRLLGEVMEPQVQLQPYVQDVSMKTSYDIQFNAHQVRMALHLYWDVMADNMEATLSAGAVVDPADQ